MTYCKSISYSEWFFFCAVVYCRWYTKISIDTFSHVKLITIWIEATYFLLWISTKAVRTLDIRIGLESLFCSHRKLYLVIVLCIQQYLLVLSVGLSSNLFTLNFTIPSTIKFRVINQRSSSWRFTSIFRSLGEDSTCCTCPVFAGSNYLWREKCVLLSILIHLRSILKV